MRHQDPHHWLYQDAQDWSESEPAPRPPVAPGKRTLTMSLPPRSPDARAPVQQTHDRAASPVHGQRPDMTEQWLHTAMRPDMYPVPAHQDMNEAGHAEPRAASAHTAVQMRARGQQPSGDVHELAAQGTSSAATTLPYRDQIQRSFGAHDVSGIAAHVGGPADRAAQAMGAAAYATGNHVAFRQSPDLHTAAHEAAHVIQQRGGVQLAGGVGRAGDPYERHADEVADLVTSGRSAEAVLDRMVGGPDDSPGEPRAHDPGGVQREHDPGVVQMSDGPQDNQQASGNGSTQGGTTPSDQGTSPGAPTFQGQVDQVEWASSHLMTAYGGDNRVNPVWTPGATDHAAAYTRNTAPTLNARFHITAQECFQATVRAKNSGAVVAEGNVSIGSDTLEASGLAVNGLPDATELARALYNLECEASVDGVTWTPLGTSGEHRIYWLVGTPQGALYSLAADKVTQYGPNDSDPATAIRMGIHTDIPYDPSDGNIEANPLSMYGGGGHVCADFANLLAALGRAAGMSASPRIYFGGISASGKMLWVRESTTGTTLAAVQPGNHSFTYHAIADVGGTVHDAALNRVGIDARAAMQGVSLELVDLSAASVSNGRVGQAYSHAITRTAQAVAVQFHSFGGLLDSGSFGQVVPVDLPSGSAGVVTVGGNWSITAGTLPPGLTLDATTGQITGTPTQAGTYTFTVQIDVGAGVTGTTSLTMQIAP
jgi:hypothetical protein